MEMGIENYIKFEEHIPLGQKLFSSYRKNDIFILPSISEGIPMVLLEIICNGLAVIATDIRGIPFPIQNKYNGILVTSKSSLDIIKYVQEIVTNTELRKELITNGLEFAKHNRVACKRSV